MYTCIYKICTDIFKNYVRYFKTRIMAIDYTHISSDSNTYIHI